MMNKISQSRCRWISPK